jgi:hypothetical protein
MIFKKKEKIKVEAYSPSGELIDLIPIVLAKDCLPSWYFNLAKNQEEIPTIRHCNGFKDLYNEGFIIRSWSDIDIQIKPNGKFMYDVASRNELPNPIEQHNIALQATGAWPDYINLKLVSPWWVRCNKVVKWAVIQPVWAQHDPAEYTLVPGILEFRYQHMTNLNLIFKVKPEPYTVHIKAGQPLAHVIPLFEDDWSLEVKFLEAGDWQRYFARWTHSFGMVYQKTRAIFGKKKL